MLRVVEVAGIAFVPNFCLLYFSLHALPGYSLGKCLMDDLAGTLDKKNYELVIRWFYFLKRAVLSNVFDIDVGHCDI